MNVTERKGRHPPRTFFAGDKLVLLVFFFLTATFLCTSLFGDFNSKSSYLPQPQVVNPQNPKGQEEEEKDPPLRSLTDPPYNLGQKITNWDSKRAEWLKLNVNFPNFFKPSKPRVLLVTGSSPKPCVKPIGDYYQLKAIKNKIDYCRIHGIDIFYNTALLDAELAGFWAKLPLLRALLLSHPEVEFFWWMDSDVFFTDMAFEIPWEKYEPYNLVFHGWDEKVYKDKDWVGLNTGSFFIRNCQWTFDLLDAWAPMGPTGPVREEAGKRFAASLKGRPVFEADDQSAIVYLLVTQRETWSDKIYLESSYYLHGYWVILVNKYEEMMEKYRPGLGDDRWPLVTHFVGCKPCVATDSSYPIDECMKQMDRAFNFADNQILQMYGFAHESLNTSNVRRVRNQIVGPANPSDPVAKIFYPSLKDANAM